MTESAAHNFPLGLTLVYILTNADKEIPSKEALKQLYCNVLHNRALNKVKQRISLSFHSTFKLNWGGAAELRKNFN